MNSAPGGFLRRHVSAVAFLHRLLDPVIATLLFYLLAKSARIGWSTSDSMTLALIFLLVFVVFGQFDLYRSWRGASFLTESRRVMAASIVVLCLLIPLGHFTKTPQLLTAQILIPFAYVTPALLILIRLIVRQALRFLRSRGMNIRRAAIVGAGDLGKKVLQQIKRDSEYGIQIVGFFDDQWSDGLRYVDKTPVIGQMMDLPDFVRNENIDIVYLALPFRAEMRMRELVRTLNDTKAALYLVPDIFIFELLHLRLIDLGGIPVFSIFDTPFIGIDGWTKRFQDILLASLILILISPLMLIIAIIIKLTSKGPALFIQKRYGLNGEEISVYKFRSMTVYEDGDSFQQATKNDPRVTKFGSFLRKTSLDELPQFINVIKGEMSVVGPRPHPASCSEYYQTLISGYFLRHRVKPGITGWAQINGWRGETETIEKMEKRVEHDLEYIRNWSIWLDLKIIFLTIFRGFRSENAY